MNEKINHPRHYNLLPAMCDKCGEIIECIEVVRHMNFNLGNVVKYVWRAGYKNADRLEDLKKARWYLDDEIKRLETELKTISRDPQSAIKDVFLRHQERTETVLRKTDES